MLCARLTADSSSAPESVSPGDALRALLAGKASTPSFLAMPDFGKQWVQVEAAAPSVNFDIKDLLDLLRDYAPAPGRERRLQRMRQLAAEGGAPWEGLAGTRSSWGSGGAVASADELRLWSVSLVKRLPDEKGAGALRTETLQGDEALRSFFEEAAMACSADFETSGHGWTVVANQLQGSASSLADLRHRLFCHTGLSGGINGYLTPAGAIGKPPHVDDHDVVVLQQAGSKAWMLLDPVSREVVEEVILRPGALLYLPQGVPHHARALSDIGAGPSLHLAVGLHRDPMSSAALLAALVTLLGLGEGKPSSAKTGRPAAGVQWLLPTAVVEEMDSRFAMFFAFAEHGPGHWLRQLAAGRHHRELVSALDAEDLPRGLEVLDKFAKLVAEDARRLAHLICTGPKAVAGDAPGAARQRAMFQAAAAVDVASLEMMSDLPPSVLRRLAGDAFFACRARVANRHFAEHGPRPPPFGAAAAADALLAADATCASSDGVGNRRWRRVQDGVAAMLWTGSGGGPSTLFANGFRLPDLSPPTVGTIRFALGAFTGAAGRPFQIADLLGECADDPSCCKVVLAKLVRVGAVEEFAD
mmetsp:Transcript_76739/g.248490  ORF Transcript_76739/g.248490 Transcript_76739/m.248490 type:complete len:586 (+) Transcript_76739:701-2458(+)